MTTRPHPPWRFTRRRNAGVGHARHRRDDKRRRQVDGPISRYLHLSTAFTSAASTSTETAWPIRSTDSTSRARCASFRISRPITPLQRTVDDLDHLPFLNQRAGIVLQLAADQQADALDFDLGNRRRLAFERHDVDDAGALQHRQRIVGIEARKAVAGKQRPVDLLLAILPAAPAGDRRQEGFDVLLVRAARARPVRGASASRSRTSCGRVSESMLLRRQWLLPRRASAGSCRPSS